MYHGSEYQVLSNRENGRGHPDVRIIPINTNKNVCILFEFKIAMSDERNEMKKCAERGLEQIVEKKYQANLPNNIKVIVEVAIAFYEKNVFVSARLPRT